MLLPAMVGGTGQWIGQAGLVWGSMRIQSTRSKVCEFADFFNGITPRPNQPKMGPK
jgi:hypothetical protein